MKTHPTQSFVSEDTLSQVRAHAPALAELAETFATKMKQTIPKGLEEILYHIQAIRGHFDCLQVLFDTALKGQMISTEVPRFSISDDRINSISTHVRKMKLLILHDPLLRPYDQFIVEAEQLENIVRQMKDVR